MQSTAPIHTDESKCSQLYFTTEDPVTGCWFRQARKARVGGRDKCSAAVAEYPIGLEESFSRNSLYTLQSEASYLGMIIRIRVSDIRQVPDPMGTGTIFYSWVTPVPDLN
jgi:hypothetical protein